MKLNEITILINNLPKNELHEITIINTSDQEFRVVLFYGKKE